MNCASAQPNPSLRDESDDEEEMERNAFRNEEDVAGFTVEPHI